jgi:hypothetical protein
MSISLPLVNVARSMLVLPLLFPEDLHGPKMVIACVEVIAEDPALGFCYERHGVH